MKQDSTEAINDDPEAYMQIISGDGAFYLPNDHRMMRVDFVNSERARILLVEKIPQSEMASDKMMQLLASAQSFSLVNTETGKETFVSLKYRHVENAETVKSLCTTLFPSAVVHHADKELMDKYKEMAELQMVDNPMLTLAEEPRKLERLDFRGVLLTNIPITLTTAMIENMFPDATVTWISRDSYRPDGKIDKIAHKYAFALYKSEEDVIKALAKYKNSETIIDGKTVNCINFCQIRELLNGDTSKLSTFKGFDDKIRFVLIHHITYLLEALRRIHQQLKQFTEKGVGPNKGQRRDMTQRKKDVVRKISAIVQHMQKDTARRNKLGIPIPDQPDEKKIVATALEEGRNILGKEMFNSYMVKKPSQPQQPKKPVSGTGVAHVVAGMKRSGGASDGPGAKKPFVGNNTRGGGQQSSIRDATRGRGGGFMGSGSMRGGGVSSGRGSSTRGGPGSGNRGGASYGRGGGGGAASSGRGRGGPPSLLNLRPYEEPHAPAYKTMSGQGSHYGRGDYYGGSEDYGYDASIGPQTVDPYARDSRESDYYPPSLLASSGQQGQAQEGFDDYGYDAAPVSKPMRRPPIPAALMQERQANQQKLNPSLIQTMQQQISELSNQLKSVSGVVNYDDGQQYNPYC